MGMERNLVMEKLINFTDKDSSPTHRTISLSDIRLSRSSQQQTTVSAGSPVSGDVVVTGNQTTGNNGTNNNTSSTIVTIKQETLASVDNLVGSFVDSTTFLHSPNSQMVNPNLVQNNGLSAAGEFEHIFFLLFRFLLEPIFFLLKFYVDFAFILLRK